MTSNKEDYLKLIYEEGGLEKTVPNKVISDKLGIAPASVTEMLTKLSQQGFIIYEPYKGSRLTGAGLEACVDLVRRHRLWEVFLKRHLGYSLREAHEDAHLLEHATPSRMIDRLDAFLNYPASCPHGFLIPQKGKAPDRPDLRRLSDFSAGETVHVVRVEEDGNLLDYLERVGLQIGETIEILSVDDYEGPLTLSQSGRSILLSFKAASQIFAEHPDEA